MYRASAGVQCATIQRSPTPTNPKTRCFFGAHWPPVPIAPDSSNMAHQPAASPKRTKPVHRKRKDLSTTVPIIPPPNALVAHTPLDLQPFKDLFNPNSTAGDAVSVSPNGHHFSATRDVVESSPAKRFKRSGGLLYPELGILSGSDSPILPSSTFSGSLPPVTQPTVSIPQSYRPILTKYTTSIDNIHQHPFGCAARCFGALCTPQHYSGAPTISAISALRIWHAVPSCPTRYARNVKWLPSQSFPDAATSLPSHAGILLPTRIRTAASPSNVVTNLLVYTPYTIISYRIHTDSSCIYVVYNIYLCILPVNVSL